MCKLSPMLKRQKKQKTLWPTVVLYIVEFYLNLFMLNNCGDHLQEG